MDLLNLATVIVFFGFIWFGFWRGLIQTFGYILGIFLGIILASRYYDDVLNFLFNNLSENTTANIVTFIILFLLIAKLTGVIFSLIFKIFNIVAILPGLKLVNRIGGAVLGAFEGALFLGVIYNFVLNTAQGTAFEEAVLNSGFIGFFTAFSSWLVPLFPEAVRKLDEMINI